MVSFFALFTSISALLAPFTIAGSAFVVNSCQRIIHYKLTNQQGDFGGGTITNGNGINVPFGADNDGVSVKMDWMGEFSSTNTLQFEFTPNDGQIFYDISAENGDPFHYSARTVGVSENSCPRIRCLPGVDTGSCEYTPASNAEPTYGCSSNAYVTFYLGPEGC